MGLGVYGQRWRQGGRGWWFLRWEENWCCAALWPLSGAFSLIYEGLDAPTGRADLRALVQARADSHFSRIHLFGPDLGERLATGIPIHPKAKVFRGETDIPGNSWTWLSSWGQQGLGGRHLGIVVFVRRENFAGFERDASNELVLLEHREDGVAYHVGAIWEGNDPLAATEQGFLSFVEEEFNHPPFYVTFPD